MAKSIRSKWKRKCRAIKRIRYGQKELERLKKTLGIEDEESTSKPPTEESLVIEFGAVANVKSAKDFQNNKSLDKNDDSKIDRMELDNIKSEFNSKTLRNKNGAYPIWVHPRKIKSNKKNKKKKQGKKKVKRND